MIGKDGWVHCDRSFIFCIPLVYPHFKHVKKYYVQRFVKKKDSFCAQNFFNTLCIFWTPLINVSVNNHACYAIHHHCMPVILMILVEFLLELFKANCIPWRKGPSRRNNFNKLLSYKLFFILVTSYVSRNYESPKFYDSRQIFM